jgi:hypothetical protein
MFRNAVCRSFELLFDAAAVHEPESGELRDQSQAAPAALCRAQGGLETGPEGDKLYKKGLVDFNLGYGIGAVGYFRRVLENNINALLDLIEEAARNAKVTGEPLAQIEAVKTSHRVEDKIDVASRILPAHLKPGGHNPLDKLYGPLSAG